MNTSALFKFIVHQQYLPGVAQDVAKSFWFLIFICFSYKGDDSFYIMLLKMGVIPLAYLKF